MSDYKWIKKHGIIGEEEIKDRMKQYEGKMFLAYCTDSFRAGRVEEKQLDRLKKENLLEVRIFSETEEICFRRSSVGEQFQWRIASEEGLDDTDFLVRYQTLDINKKRMEKLEKREDSFGNKILYTTVGGEYVLPIEEEEDSSKIIMYIEYDKNGMAKAVDYRIFGFVQRFGKEKVM